MNGAESFDVMNLEATSGINYFNGTSGNANMDKSHGVSAPCGEPNEFPDRSPIFNYLHECRVNETSLPSKLKNKFDKNRNPRVAMGDESNTRDGINTSQPRDQSRDKNESAANDISTPYHEQTPYEDANRPSNRYSPQRKLVENLDYEDVHIFSDAEDRLNQERAEAAIHNYKTFGGPTIVDSNYDPLDYQIIEELGAETGTDSDRKNLPSYFRYNDSNDSRDVPGMSSGVNNLTPELASGRLVHSNYENFQDDGPRAALVNSYTASQLNNFGTGYTTSSEFGKTGLPESYVSRLPKIGSDQSNFQPLIGSGGEPRSTLIESLVAEQRPTLVESLVAEGRKHTESPVGRVGGVAENTERNISPVRHEQMVIQDEGHGDPLSPKDCEELEKIRSDVLAIKGNQAVIRNALKERLNN